MARILRKGFTPPAREGWPSYREVWQMPLVDRLALPDAPARALPRWVLDPEFRASSDEHMIRLIEEREGPEAAQRCREGQVEAGIEADRQWQEYLAGRLTL